jgi:hypothetical protein
LRRKLFFRKSPTLVLRNLTRNELH